MTDETTTHPRILLTHDGSGGLRTVQDLSAAIQRPGISQQIWQGIQATAEESWHTEPIHVHTPLEGRSEADQRRGNREYIVVNAAGHRVLCSALASLLTQDTRHVDAALAQLDCLFDEAQWPEWQDIFHREKFGFDADLRTGQLSRDVALAYDWLHPFLTQPQRQRIVAGLDERGIQPFLRAVEAGAWWVERMNNWNTVIVGGLGICGMALTGVHPQAQQLIDMATGSMRSYLEHYGPEGEFNENPAYANSSTLPVLYFHALRYHENQPGVSPEIQALHRHCFWCMYATAPPGVLVSFGDCAGQRYPALTTFFPAVAAATRDTVLQWFYTTYGTQSPVSPIWELLWFDDTLQAQPPTPENLPLGRRFAAHSGLISSRSDWNPQTTASIVFGKAGTARVNHTHPDGGQIEILGHNRPLIVDLGSVNYPSQDKDRYYHFNSDGHNQVTLGGRPQRYDLEHEAVCVASDFDNARGGWWRIDLTDLHEGVTAVRRTVIHLLPDIVVVFDEAQLHGPESIRLRWHPGGEPELGPAGRFCVTVDEVTLSAQIDALGLDPADLQSGHHAYVAPYDQDRIGNPMPQQREPYVDLCVAGKHARLLSLFAIGGVGERVPDWRRTGPASWSWDGWTPPDEAGPMSHVCSSTESVSRSTPDTQPGAASATHVQVEEEHICVQGPAGSWRVPIA
jgi:hypothetical protein